MNSSRIEQEKSRTKERNADEKKHENDNNKNKNKSFDDDMENFEGNILQAIFGHGYLHFFRQWPLKMEHSSPESEDEESVMERRKQ